jgi:hypothetical protein
MIGGENPSVALLAKEKRCELDALRTGFEPGCMSIKDGVKVFNPAEPGFEWQDPSAFAAGTGIAVPVQSGLPTNSVIAYVPAAASQLYMKENVGPPGAQLPQ